MDSTENDQTTSANQDDGLYAILQQILEQQPNTEFLDLSSQNIYDISQIADYLYHFPMLNDLNLENNVYLTQLPNDLSQTLASVKNLNVKGITFYDFEATIDSLATIPNLKSLYIILEEEDQVDVLMKGLPDLEFLNGIPVEHEEVDDDDSDNSFKTDSEEGD